MTTPTPVADAIARLEKATRERAGHYAILARRADVQTVLDAIAEDTRDLNEGAAAMERALAAELERDGWRDNYFTVADAVARESTGPEDLARQARETRQERDAAETRAKAAERERDDLDVRWLSLLTELWGGVRAHGLWAPTKGRDGERLIHAYCGGIVKANQDRDAARARVAEMEAALRALVAWVNSDAVRGMSQVAFIHGYRIDKEYHEQGAPAWKLVNAALAAPRAGGEGGT